MWSFVSSGFSLVTHGPRPAWFRPGWREQPISYEFDTNVWCSVKSLRYRQECLFYCCICLLLQSLWVDFMVFITYFYCYFLWLLIVLSWDSNLKLYLHFVLFWILKCLWVTYINIEAHAYSFVLIMIRNIRLNQTWNFQYGICHVLKCRYEMLSYSPLDQICRILSELKDQLT